MICQHILLEDKNTKLDPVERFNCRGQHWRWAVSWFWFLRNLHVFWAQPRVIYIFAPRTAATAWIVDPTRQLLQLGFDFSSTCVFNIIAKVRILIPSSAKWRHVQQLLISYFSTHLTWVDPGGEAVVSFTNSGNQSTWLHLSGCAPSFHRSRISWPQITTPSWFGRRAVISIVCSQ